MKNNFEHYIKEHLIFRPLQASDEAEYKALLLRNHRYQKQMKDPSWKEDLFVNDFVDVVASFNNTNSRIISINHQIQGEALLNAYSGVITVDLWLDAAIQAAGLEPLIKQEFFRQVDNSVYKQLSPSQIDFNIKVQRMTTQLKQVPKMVLRFFKILPGWM